MLLRCKQCRHIRGGVPCDWEHVDVSTGCRYCCRCNGEMSSESDESGNSPRDTTPETIPMSSSPRQGSFSGQPSSDVMAVPRQYQPRPNSPYSPYPQVGPQKCERINPSTGRPCNSVYSRPYDLTRHEETIHNARKRKVRCELCTEEKTFSRNDVLARHMRIVHPEVSWPPGKSRRAVSRPGSTADLEVNTDPISNQSLGNMQDYNIRSSRSLQEATPEESPADSVSNSFSTDNHSLLNTQDLRIDIQIQSATQEGTPNLLPSSSNDISKELTSFFLPQSNISRPHVCSTCQRGFAQLTHLKRHETRSHNAEKSFECPDCTRSFARRDLLLRHQQKFHIKETSSSRPTNCPGGRISRH